MLKKIAFCLAFSLAFLQGRVILDGYGEKVNLPDKVERASPMTGGILQIAVALGNGDKIISGAYRGLYPMMLKVFPKIRTTGFRGGSLGASVETLIASNTQVVFGPASVLFDDNVKKQLENAGIAVVRLSDKFSTADEVKDCVAKIAEIFGDESVKRAREFNAYFDSNIAFVKSRISKNAAVKRVLVLNLNAGNFSGIAQNFIGAAYIRAAGGENLSASLMNSWGSHPNLSEEQVIVYDPDIIITNSKESRENILKNRTFKQLKAVRERQIFVQPRGVSYFWTGTEGALQVLWLAKILHPNEFKDLDMRAKVREFYAKFYRYDLSEGELDEIFDTKERARLY